MGVCFYAVNRNTGRAYELGKGDWDLLAPIDGSIPMSRVFLKSIVYQVLSFPSWEQELKDDTEYQEEIVQGILAIGGSDLTVRLVREDDEGPGFHVVGTRYRTRNGLRPICGKCFEGSPEMGKTVLWSKPKMEVCSHCKDATSEGIYI